MQAGEEGRGLEGCEAHVRRHVETVSHFDTPLFSWSMLGLSAAAVILNVLVLFHPV